MSMHADLSFHVLRYALQRVHDGDLSAALDLGFTIDEIRSMEALTLNDLEHLSRLSAHFLRVQVDHDIYRAMIHRVTEEAQSKDTQDALLRAGAPRSLMAEMYGWSSLQYAHRRRLLGITSTPGRPPQPTERRDGGVAPLAIAWPGAAGTALPASRHGCGRHGGGSPQPRAVVGTGGIQSRSPAASPVPAGVRASIQRGLT